MLVVLVKVFGLELVDHTASSKRRELCKVACGGWFEVASFDVGRVNVVKGSV